MENHFDAFSKSLAESVSRRDMLRRLGAVFAGAVLGPLALAAGSGLAAQPRAKPSAKVARKRGCDCADDRDCPVGQLCCSGVCVNACFDNLNCGACGFVCDSGFSCQAGVCQPIDP